MTNSSSACDLRSRHWWLETMQRLVSLLSVALLMLWFSIGTELRAQEILLTPDIEQKEVPVVFGSDRVKEFPVTVKSDNNKWSFVKFDEIPQNTLIRIRA